METLPSWLLPFIGQVPLVLLFMWYQDRQETRRIAYEAALEDKRIAAANANHKEWRSFLLERDTTYHASQARLAEEIKASANVLAGVQALLIAHDTKTTAAIGDVHRIRERLAQAGIGDIEDSPLPEGKYR